MGYKMVNEEELATLTDEPPTEEQLKLYEKTAQECARAPFHGRVILLLIHEIRRLRNGK